MRIRFLILLLLGSFLMISCHREDSYTLYGKLRCVRAKTAYLMEMDPMGKPFVVDSVPIRSGSGEFKFKGRVDYPTMRFIRIGSRPPFDVFVENGKIEITGSLMLPDEIKVEGSSSHDDFNYLSKEMRKIQNKQSSMLVHISNARKQNNQREVKRLTKIYNSYPDSLLSMTKQFVENKPYSMGAVYFVCSLSQSYDIERLEGIISSFDASLYQSPYMKYLKEELALHKDFVLGMKAPDFRLPTFLGDSVSLSDYSGKYLFIDFGASWCERTKTRTAKLKRMHDLYEGKNFDVLSVFLDEDKKDWKDYVTSLGVLPWKLCCDFKYWSSPVSKYYRVHSIPYGVLITPSGEIALVDPNLYVMENYLRKKLK